MSILATCKSLAPDALGALDALLLQVSEGRVLPEDAVGDEVETVTSTEGGRQLRDLIPAKRALPVALIGDLVSVTQLGKRHCRGRGIDGVHARSAAVIAGAVVVARWGGVLLRALRCRRLIRRGRRRLIRSDRGLLRGLKVRVLRGGCKRGSGGGCALLPGGC